VRFILGNRLLDRAGGTEVHMVTVGEQLQRLGHEVLLYSPVLGAFSAAAERRGLTVAGRLEDLPEACDVVLAQDTIVSHDLAGRYPEALHVFRICGDVYDFQLPPQVPGLVDLVVVLSDRYERQARGCAVQPRVLRLRTPIDVDRLVPAGPIAEQPRRAVLLGNYPERTGVVEAACARHGIEVARVGGAAQSFDVAGALAGADIVFAKSRAALDAMACGRAVYVLDVFGGDGWVTPESYPDLEADHFAGLATGLVVDIDALDRDLAAYDPGMGTANRDLTVQHHHPRDHVLALLAALGERSPAPRPQAPLRELARLTALTWSWESAARQRRDAEGALRVQVADVSAAAARAEAHARDLERRLAEAEARASALDRRVSAMRATRAWRLAERWWRVQARLRRPAR
jgi:hypothetical protein